MRISKKGKLLILFSIMLFLILGSTFVLAFTRDEKREIRLCTSECSFEGRIEKRECSSGYRGCSVNCRVEYRTCLNEVKNDRNLCREDCSVKRENGEIESSSEFSMCRRDCSKKFNLDRKEKCDIRSCVNECRKYKGECYVESNIKQLMCETSCELPFVKDEILEEEIDFSADEESCQNSNGFYQKLCKGHFFRMICSKENYCLCGGDNQYTCPETHLCVKDFDIELKENRGRVEGWRNQHGYKLGDIGICANI